MSGGAGGNSRSNGDPYRHAYGSNGAIVSNSDGVIRYSPIKTRPSGRGAYNVSDIGGMSQDNFYDALRDLVKKSKKESIANEIAMLKKNAAHWEGTDTWENLLKLEIENKAHDIQKNIEAGVPITEEEHKLYREAPLPNEYRPNTSRAPANSDDGYADLPMLRGGKRYKRKQSRKFRARKNRRTRHRH